MYPILKDGVSLGTFQCEGSETTHYFVENVDGQEFEVSRRLWNALLQADGTQPLALPDKGKKLLPVLKKHNLVQISRFVRDDGIFNRLIVFPIGRKTKTGSIFFKAINAVLPVVAIMMLAIGVYQIATRGCETGYNYNWCLFYVLFICSLAFHEARHLIAGLAYGYRISDTGILLLGIIPIGAYVAHEDKKDALRSEKIQFALAGIESNLMIAGICLIVAVQNTSLASTMVAVANMNMILAGINLLPTSGLDGESALSAVFNIESIQKVAKKWLLNRKRRKKLLHSGLRGCVCFCVFLYL